MANSASPLPPFAHFHQRHVQCARPQECLRADVKPTKSARFRSLRLLGGSGQGDQAELVAGGQHRVARQHPHGVIRTGPASAAASSSRRFTPSPVPVCAISTVTDPLAHRRRRPAQHPCTVTSFRLSPAARLPSGQLNLSSGVSGTGCRRRRQSRSWATLLPAPAVGCAAGRVELGARGPAKRLRRRRVVMLDVVAHHSRSQHLGPSVCRVCRTISTHRCGTAFITALVTACASRVVEARRPPGRRDGSRPPHRRQTVSPNRFRRRTTSSHQPSRIDKQPAVKRAFHA